MTVKGAHIFAMADWGGLDGTLNPVEGRPQLVAYKWGVKKGPSVFPRSRYNKDHSVQLCSHKEFIACFQSHGKSDCPATCGYMPEDENPQLLVANAFNARAAVYKPEYVLNPGDNFYWGGIEKTCGTPMHELSFTAFHQFNQVFENVYNGPGLKGLPWLSV